MSILTDWSLFAPFLVKGIISCLLIGVVGMLITNINAFYEPEDDM